MYIYKKKKERSYRNIMILVVCSNASYICTRGTQPANPKKVRHGLDNRQAPHRNFRMKDPYSHTAHQILPLKARRHQLAIDCNSTEKLDSRCLASISGVR